jgi:hypothetical protein
MVWVSVEVQIFGPDQEMIIIIVNHIQISTTSEQKYKHMALNMGEATLRLTPYNNSNDSIKLSTSHHFKNE